jgi:predicted DNA-binding transcriptional regulator YafY
VGQSDRKKRNRPAPSPPVTAAGRPDSERRLRQADRFSRILRLLELLQDPLVHDARSLAVQLGATERTVYRDLKVIALAGMPFCYDPERGGYVLRGDYRFAIAGLSDDELLGQATAAALTSTRGLDVGEGAGPVIRKLKATGRERVQSLLADALRVTEVLDLGLANHEGHREAIRTIQHALIEKVALEGTYTSPYRPGEELLLLHPIRLCLVKQAWYLIARPDGTDHPMTYRVARFGSLRKLGLRSEVPEEFDLRGYFGDAWAVFRGKTSYEVDVCFSPEASGVVVETTWHHTQQSRKNEDGSITLSFRVDGLEEIIWWVLGWSGSVEVIRPPELRRMVVDRLQMALVKHGGDATSPGSQPLACTDLGDSNSTRSELTNS